MRRVRTIWAVRRRRPASTGLSTPSPSPDLRGSLLTGETFVITTSLNGLCLVIGDVDYDCDSAGPVVGARRSIGLALRWPRTSVPWQSRTQVSSPMLPSRGCGRCGRTRPPGPPNREGSFTNDHLGPPSIQDIRHSCSFPRRAGRGGRSATGHTPLTLLVRRCLDIEVRPSFAPDGQAEDGLLTRAGARSTRRYILDTCPVRGSERRHGGRSRSGRPRPSSVSSTPRTGCSVTVATTG